MPRLPASDFEWCICSLARVAGSEEFFPDLLRLPLRLFWVSSELGTAATILLLILLSLSLSKQVYAYYSLWYYGICNAKFVYATKVAICRLMTESVIDGPVLSCCCALL